MSDRFRPISADRLFRWVFGELESRDSIFGIPGRHFFVPDPGDPFRTQAFGHPLETPFGPAAGPHTQMAQNIVAAWLCGARYIELKTVQTLDELEVSKPCIDMEDEGYNVEWSQELKVHESFDEYLRAWLLIHALHHRLGFPGSPGIVFNLSVGYDLAGIRQPNVQWFLDRSQDCTSEKRQMQELLARHYPPAAGLDIPARMSDNVTLSTMHGCPPDEIGAISEYLLRDRGLHTYVKCNPTLLGPERVRGILNNDLGYFDAVVPDAAFAHDLAWDDAVPLLRHLGSVARSGAREFGVKLSNTLEVENWRTVFDPAERMMYLSGRPLHAITLRLAARLAGEFDGELPMSFSAGADCFNAPRLLACGLQTVTTCSDLLKSGGYRRLLQYVEETRRVMKECAAPDLAGFIGRFACEPGASTTAMQNLDRYAEQVSGEARLRKDALFTSRSKTSRELGWFDCIKAPCTDACAIGQQVPRYMSAVRTGRLEDAVRLTCADNPIPVLLGRTCDHLCEPACIRTHLDEPLAIRHVKRFIMEHEAGATEGPETVARPLKVAVIGAGPGGLAVASELARAGVRAEIFEQHAYAGGMVGGAIPEYRLPRGVIDQDLARLKALGVEFHYEQAAGRDFSLQDLRDRGFQRIVITVGAQLGKKLGLPGEDCEGVIDALEFLRGSREGHPMNIGPRIGIIGAGDTAMDCARTAWRRAGDGVEIIYRRSLDQMPADREEIRCLLEEGIGMRAMARPLRLVVEDGRLRGVVCRRMEYRGERDASGRKIPFEVEGEDFEVPLDTLILAISQHAVLDFFGKEDIRINDRGYIQTDPETFRTSVPGVYAGGDVVNEGPSSIVEAAADGKAIARAILEEEGNGSEPAGARRFDTANLMLRRSTRQWRVPVPHTDPDDRRNFSEVVLGYDEAEAQAEAARCLDCDRYCSICVGVCPNLALQTLESEPFAVDLPRIALRDGEFRKAGTDAFRVDQAYQVAVLADLCNECGNCTTFCPTSGDPYRDKPRVYLDRGEFESQADNAFLASHDGRTWRMEGRFDGVTHRIELDNRLDYTSPWFRADIEPGEFAVAGLEALPERCTDGEYSLEPCAVMYALLTALRKSAPHWLQTAAGARTDHED